MGRIVGWTCIVTTMLLIDHEINVCNETWYTGVSNKDYIWLTR